MSGSVQELMQQALAMLGSAPRTAENLNRAMLAITRGEAAPADGFDMNAQVDRMIDRSTPRRANVPRNTQPNAVVGASGTAPDKNTVVGDPTLPMPPPDVATAAEQTGQRRTIVPGEGMIYTAPVATPSSLDGNGMTARLLRDLVMGAESAGAVSGALSPVARTPSVASSNLPNIRLGMNRPQLAGPSGNVVSLGDDAASAAVSNTPRPMLPGSGGAQTQLPAPMQTLPAPTTPPSMANLSPTQQRALAGPDLPPGTPSGLTPRQRATLMGPGQAGDAAFRAARVREGGPRGQTSRAAQQRAANRNNASD